MRRRRTVFALILAIAAIGLVALMMSGGSSLSSSPSSTSDTPEQELDAGEEARGGQARGRAGGARSPGARKRPGARRKPQARSVCSRICRGPPPLQRRGWTGRAAGDQPDGQRLGTGDRRRPERSVRLQQLDHAKHRTDRVRQQVPASLHDAQGLFRRGPHAGPGTGISARARASAASSTRSSKSCRTQAPSTRRS